MQFPPVLKGCGLEEVTGGHCLTGVFMVGVAGSASRDASTAAHCFLKGGVKDAFFSFQILLLCCEVVSHNVVNYSLVQCNSSGRDFTSAFQFR